MLLRQSISLIVNELSTIPNLNWLNYKSYLPWFFNNHRDLFPLVHDSRTSYVCLKIYLMIVSQFLDIFFPGTASETARRFTVHTAAVPPLHAFPPVNIPVVLYPNCELAHFFWFLFGFPGIFCSTKNFLVRDWLTHLCEWVSELVNGWVRDWVSEWVSEWECVCERERIREIVCFARLFAFVKIYKAYQN